jgi:hypothetical protein
MSGVWPLRILTTIDQSFLLIFCTERIVTDRSEWRLTSTVGYNRFSSK